METALLSPKEAAAYLGLSVRTLQNWRALGKGPRYVAIVSNRPKYRLADLESFVATYTVGSGEAA